MVQTAAGEPARRNHSRRCQWSAGCVQGVLLWTEWPLRRCSCSCPSTSEVCCPGGSGRTDGPTARAETLVTMRCRTVWTVWTVRSVPFRSTVLCVGIALSMKPRACSGGHVFASLSAAGAGAVWTRARMAARICSGRFFHRLTTWLNSGGTCASGKWLHMPLSGNVGGPETRAAPGAARPEVSDSKSLLLRRLASEGC